LAQQLAVADGEQVRPAVLDPGAAPETSEPEPRHDEHVVGRQVQDLFLLPEGDSIVEIPVASGMP
jgi:hypothetical protein